MSTIYLSTNPCKKCGSHTRYRHSSHCAQCAIARTAARKKADIIGFHPKNALDNWRVKMKGVRYENESGYLA